jgi:hypothetical protein
MRYVGYCMLLPVVRTIPVGRLHLYRTVWATPTADRDVRENALSCFVVDLQQATGNQQEKQ